MLTRTISFSALTLFAVGLSAWSIFFSKATLPNNTLANRSDPDTFMENVTATLFDGQGKISLKIITPKITHTENNDTATLYKPHIIAYKESPVPWSIDADKAETIAGTQKILLQGNVIIHHEHDQKNPTSTMTTNALTLFPDKQLAETNQPITVTQPDLLIRAIGMRADMKLGTIQLFSKATGEYAL